MKWGHKNPNIARNKEHEREEEKQECFI